MDKTILLEFSYRVKTYYAIVRIKTNNQENCYQITIMSGELERALYGNHIIIEEDGVLQSAPYISKTEVRELRHCIETALCHHLQVNGFQISLQEYADLN